MASSQTKSADPTQHLDDDGSPDKKGVSKSDPTVKKSSDDARREVPRGVDRKDPQAHSKESEEASAAVARHVALLREYNEIKDVGQQLMGLVAENRGVTVGSLYETGEFGVGPKD